MKTKTLFFRDEGFHLLGMIEIGVMKVKLGCMRLPEKDDRSIREISGCTSCGYCYPCPTGVNIPKCLSLYDQGIMFDNRIRYKNEYETMEKFERAHNCMACGRCEKRCPQKIEIIKMLRQVDQYFKDQS